MTPSLSIIAQVPPISGQPIPTETDPTTLATPAIDWTVLAPFITLALGALILLTITSLVRGRLFNGFYAVYTVVIAAAAAAWTIPLWFRVTDDGAFTAIGGALGIDGFGLFVIAEICAAVILGALIADNYLRREGIDGPELYVLMLLSATGGAIMATADDLIVLFLGLETLSIAAYVLAALHLRRIQSQEAGMKYFILGAFSSAFLLYGIAFVYGATGSTNLVAINEFLATTVPIDNGLLLLGFALLLVGFGFKVAAVPFHSWAPDVYQGSPSPVVAYMAAGIKAAGFAGLIRVFYLTFGGYRADWQPIVYVLAVLSMVGGALLAIVQSDVKRMLAYSSISHAGFILVGVTVATQQGVSAVLWYLGAYTFMVAGSFAVVTVVSGRGDGNTSLDAFRGLSRTTPQLAFFFTVFLLAQAGVPFTTGFYAKFYVISAAADAEEYTLAVIAMLSAVVAAYLYLRIIIAMYLADAPETEGDAESDRRLAVPLGAGVALAICLLVTIGFGIFPDPPTDWADEGVPMLVQYDIEPAASSQPIQIGP